MIKKPCIICDKECERMPLQLGDAFTLTLLYLCSDACLWETALNYIYESCEYKGYRNYLAGLMLPEDKQELREYHEKRMEVIRSQRESPEYHADMLSTPMPNFIYSPLAGECLPLQSGSTYRFTRPTRDQKVSALQEAVERTKNILKDYEEDLQKILGE
jgi:hypothetical protein